MSGKGVGPRVSPLLKHLQEYLEHASFFFFWKVLHVMM